MRLSLFFLIGISLLQTVESNAQVAPLLSTTWNQTCYYNADLPTTGTGGACGKVYTGCNATAIGQIMKYYNYPTSGMGSHCNTTNSSYCVDFSIQTYDYSLMPNSLSSANTEVAKLMLHVGIAVNMTWSGTNSTSFFNTEALKKHFLYSPKMYSTATFMFSNTQELIDALKNELNEGRVVFCKTNTLNHFYLIDGYNSSDQFHCNFGWGGTYDGYYDITNVSIVPGNATPQNFIFNIKPLQGSLETAVDTIHVAANLGLKSIEFTSLNNWTMSTNAPWISLNQTSGTPGYYNSTSSVNFNYQINHGEERFGNIYINNGVTTDTVVVIQAASPLVVNPENILFTDAGGSETISIEWYSWSNWNATTSDTWMTLSQITGTGNGTIALTASSNPSSTEREGYVVFTGSIFSDTVFVTQEAMQTTGIDENTSSISVSIYPNPAENRIHIHLPDDVFELTLLDLSGKIIHQEKITQQSIHLDVSKYQSGVYFLNLSGPQTNYVEKFLVK